MEIDISPLEFLKVEGWSYSIGYIQQFKAYVCRIYKPLEKPRTIRTAGGKDICYTLETYSGQGDTPYFAIHEAIIRKNNGIIEEKRN